MRGKVKWALDTDCQECPLRNVPSYLAARHIRSGYPADLAALVSKLLCAAAHISPPHVGQLTVGAFGTESRRAMEMGGTRTWTRLR